MTLFLDIDGTLHTMSRVGGVLSCLPAFEAVLREFPDLEIVISSSWRTFMSIEQLRALFSADLRDQIVDVTPCFDDRGPMAHRREAEIRKWLRANARHPERWIALDDCDWLFSPGCPNLALVNPDVGFDEAAASALVQKLTAKEAS